jgi:anti-sigma factor RsiW
MMQSNCRFEKYISPYIDGELGPQQTADIRVHLNSCTVCHALYRKYAGADERLRSLESIPVSSEFDRAFWRKADQQDQRRRRFGLGWGFRPALAAAATLLLVAGLLFLPSDTRKAGLSAEQVVIAENLDFFSDYEVVRHLDLLENWDEINEPADA